MIATMKITEIALNELAVDARYATKAETAILAQKLTQAMPDYRFEVEKKSVSPVIYIRIFGAEKQAMLSYFKQLGLDSLPAEPEQAAISGKYRGNILSFQTSARAIEEIPAGKAHQVDPEVQQRVTTIIYTLVVASSGQGKEGGVAVSIKEFTPVTLGLAGQQYTKSNLVKATKQAVLERTKTRPELTSILLGLVDIAAGGGRGTLPPEINQHLSDRARNQLSVDFGEILAPLMFANGTELIEFPKEGNFPLVDVIVGQNKYSVKSLTGSGTSFRSISDLMDNYEKSIEGDDSQEQLFKLFKGYHPSAGGKNVDKIIRAAALVGVPEYKEAVEKFGEFNNWDQLYQRMQVWPWKEGTKAQYKHFLEHALAVFTATWSKTSKPTPKANLKFVGMPADGKFYLGSDDAISSDNSDREKVAGYPSFRANPFKAAADIITYSLGVGTLNYVTKGPTAGEYAKMMTNIVNQSEAHLGRLDITDSGGLVVATKPFKELAFKFQYHAPSHLPGNNLPGFMIVY
jgi:hypothetical protein